jgi:3-oxoadipate enol-lactonase
MSFINLDWGRLHYQLDGPTDAPLVVLSNSLGTDINMWTPQLTAFNRHLRVLRYDTRGHDHSVVTPGPYSIDLLGQDVLTLLDSLDIERAHFCGISMGGLTGLWLGVHAPQRLNKLVVCDTAARVGTAEGWQARAKLVREEGMPEVADGAADRWFTPHFIQHQPQLVDMLLKQLRNSPPAGYAACCDALAVADLRQDIARIQLPTLVVCGAHDPVTTPADARYIVEQVKGARYVELDASHLSNVEAAEAFNDAVVSFLVNEQ